MSDREYPVRPILGVAGVIFQDDAVLLARRASEPALGEWSLPGGVVELGESMQAALEREILEEASVRIRVAGLVQLVERVIRDGQGRIQYHYVIADYWGWLVQGRLEAGSDVSEVRIVSTHRLGGFVLHPDVKWTIQEALKLRRGSGCGG